MHRGRLKTAICCGLWQQCAPMRCAFANAHSESLACVQRMRKPMNARAFELPPLELLVAFESAARHLSFTRAGAEIALTQSAVSRQVLALEDRLGVPLFRRLHRALALTEDGADLLRRHPRSLEPARPRDARDPPQRAGADRRRHDDAGLRRPLADPAPGELRRRPSRGRRSHLGEQRARQPRARRRRHRHPLSAGANGRAGRRRSPVRRDRLARCAARACCARRIRRWRGRPISPRTPCCAWSPTAATSCRTGASGCRR